MGLVSTAPWMSTFHTRTGRFCSSKLTQSHIILASFWLAAKISADTLWFLFEGAEELDPGLNVERDSLQNLSLHLFRFCSCDLAAVVAAV